VLRTWPSLFSNRASCPMALPEEKLNCVWQLSMCQGHALNDFQAQFANIERGSCDENSRAPGLHCRDGSFYGAKCCKRFCFKSTPSSMRIIRCEVLWSSDARNSRIRHHPNDEVDGWFRIDFAALERSSPGLAAFIFWLRPGLRE